MQQLPADAELHEANGGGGLAPGHPVHHHRLGGHPLEVDDEITQRGRRHQAGRARVFVADEGVAHPVGAVTEQDPVVVAVQHLLAGFAHPGAGGDPARVGDTDQLRGPAPSLGAGGPDPDGHRHSRLADIASQRLKVRLRQHRSRAVEPQDQGYEAPPVGVRDAGPHKVHEHGIEQAADLHHLHQSGGAGRGGGLLVAGDGRGVVGLGHGGVSERVQRAEQQPAQQSQRAQDG